jgi:lipopolysaccharide biosynthesis regulator YciM
MLIEWMALLWLLLPVAAFSGWWVARRGMKAAALDGQQGIHPEYFKGLNFVLNEQPDKAIEIFIKMLEVDSETVETHLALGNLFRRRGEVDRAIRIHQNLIARPTLDREQRAMALLELGMDYMSSGLLDRAEGLFKELAETGLYSIQALSELLEIYQQEKDWDNAINTARKLELTTGKSLNPVIAQFYCEQASNELSKGDIKLAKDCIRRALNMDPNCVRASLIEAEMAVNAGRLKQALKAYKRTETQDPEYIPEVIQPMLECYRNLDKLDEFMDFLRKIIHKHGGITPLLMLTELIKEQNSEEEAVKYISVELRKRPTVKGVDRLIEYAISKVDGEARESLSMIKDLTGKLLEEHAMYKCVHCGFDAKFLHWQCPGCKSWNTVKPVHGVEGE